MDPHILVRQDLRKLEVLLREHRTNMSHNQTNGYFLYVTVTHFASSGLRSTSIALRTLLKRKNFLSEDENSETSNVALWNVQ
jgi:hypothetical protein